MHRHFSPSIPLVVTLAMMCSAAMPLFAQSLADVAREEAARRKKIAEPSKTYTEKDLKPVPPSIAPAAPEEPSSASTDEAPAAAAESETSSDEQPAGPAKGQEEWAAGMKERQDKLDRDQVLVEAVQNRINSLTADFTARDDPAQRALIGQDRQRALDELDRLHKDIADDQQAITDYEDEARRAGVPPGWLRN